MTAASPGDGAPRRRRCRLVGHSPAAPQEEEIAQVHKHGLGLIDLRQT